MKLIKKLLKNFGNFPFFVVKVEGESGWPVLISGKFYFASHLLKPRAGDFIVFKNPLNSGWIFVKKIRKIEGEKYFVEGIVSWSSSSRDFGLVFKDLFLGKLLFL